MIRTKLGRFVLGALAIALFLTGCAGEDKSAAPREAEKFTVVTSFYPIYIATINVTRGVDGVEVVNMTKPQTGCLHDYQLTTDDLKLLERADAFVINGAGMEDFLQKALRQREKLRMVDASKNIPLISEYGIDNPHVWVSVSNAILQVKNIAEQLAALDQVHAGQYRENALAYIEQLEALRAEMHREIDDLPNKDIVTFHEAFPYFAEEFHLNIVSVIAREPGSEPSPKELEDTIQKIKALHVNALFAEPQYPAGSADTIARESGAKVYTLDPVVTGEANENAMDAYILAMKENAKVLKAALR